MLINAARSAGRYVFGMRILESLSDWDTDVAVIDDLEGDVLDHEQRAAAPLRSIESDVLDDLGLALGLAYEDGEELWFGDKEASRDAHRWELDPASAEDWAERGRR
jgi:hypothetical protein